LGGWVGWEEGWNEGIFRKRKMASFCCWCRFGFVFFFFPQILQYEKFGEFRQNNNKKLVKCVIKKNPQVFGLKSDKNFQRK
jgi:hypothetical protein